MKIPGVAALLALLFAAAAHGDDEFTLYELLAPESHRFAITYDVATATAGARFFFNPIREGSVATDERVIERGRGRELKWEVVKGREAKATGLVRPTAADESLYIKVALREAVPAGGMTRLRIFKTYLDPKSYYAEGDTVVFDRGLSIRRNAVVLPPGYELIGCSVPAIVSTEADGRVKVSVVNDRDDSLPVRIVGRRVRSAK
jgi:hypothetical protein